MNKVNLARALTVVFTLFSSSLVWAGVSEIEEYQFDVSADAKIKLENINGSVKFNADNGQTIRVVAEKKAESQEKLDNIEVKTSFANNQLMVATEYLKKSDDYDNPGSVSYKVTLPASMAKTEVDLVNGSLKMSGVAGDIKAQLVNGSIKLDGANGNVDLASVNGSIKARVESVPAKVNQIKLNTVNGSIKLKVPESINATVDASTMHGSLSNNLGLQTDKSIFSGKSMEGTLGSGDVAIDLESVNGSIAIKSGS